MVESAATGLLRAAGMLRSGVDGRSGRRIGARRGDFVVAAVAGLRAALVVIFRAVFFATGGTAFLTVGLATFFAADFFAAGRAVFFAAIFAFFGAFLTFARITFLADFGMARLPLLPAAFFGAALAVFFTAAFLTAAFFLTDLATTFLLVDLELPLRALFFLAINILEQADYGRLCRRRRDPA